MKTKRAFLIEPGRFENQEVEIEPGPDQMLIKISVCGLCNWEQNHWKGLIGSCPQSLGHEWAGIVTKLGENVKGFEIGDVVTGLEGGMSGFSEYLVTNAKGCYKLEPHVNPEHALGEPLKCIVTVLRAAAPEAGDFGVVVGCGPMGLWCIQALSGNLLGGLIAIDIDDKKLELARKMGATHIINSQKENAEQRIAEITERRMADFVIEGSGIPSLLNTAVSYIKFSGRGRLIMMSSHEEACEKFDFREAMNKGIEIRVPHPRYSLDPNDDLRRAVQYLNNDVFKMDEIITHKFRLDEIQKAFETLENKPKDYIKGVVVP